MSNFYRPMRSALYVPASNSRALEKARDLPADAIIFDLEDAVSAPEKSKARTQLLAALADGEYGGRFCLVRVNGLDTAWGRDDLAAFAGAATDGILIPKVNGTADITAADELCPKTPIWAMMETPQGILNAAGIAAHARVGGLVMGTNDLAKELRSRYRADREPLLSALQTCLLAARAAGIICVDGVYNAFRDAEGLRRECEQGRDMGFDGKTLIHPGQIDIANRVFGPDKDDVDLARRQIAAYEVAQAQGAGVAVVDGRIVENLHIETARATLAQWNAISTVET